MRAQLANHRKIIVLLADEDKQSASDRQISSTVGQTLFHENLEQREALARQFDALLQSDDPARFATVEAMLDYVEAAPDLYDADRLASPKC